MGKNIGSKYVNCYIDNNNIQEYVGTIDDKYSIELSVPGRYIITNKNPKNEINERMPVVALSIISVVALLIYLIINKRYWLW